MEPSKSTLVVSLHNIEFAKEYHYFITVQLESDGQKRRTDISACVTNPVFTASVFMIPLSSLKIGLHERLHFAAFVVTDRLVGDQQPKNLESQGQARLLGECSLDLASFSEQLTAISGVGVRQYVKFTRQQGQQEVTVGRFIVNLKLVGDEVIPVDEKDFKPLEKDDIFHELPRADPFFDFAWRIKIDIKAGVDLPLNRVNPSGLPTSFVECGWTLYDNQIPDDFSMHLTNLVENNRHPLWNQQFIITNPEQMTNKEGFIYVSIKDKFVTEPIDTFYIPIINLRPFIPIHFEFMSTKGEYEARPKYFISLVLDMPIKDSFVDQLTDIAVHLVHFDPLPYINKMVVGMTLNNHRPESLTCVQQELSGAKNIGQAIQENMNEKKCVFQSLILRIPPFQTETVYKAVAVFTLPKSYLERDIQFFISARDDSIPAAHGMPNGIGGFTDILDETLMKLYFAKDKKPANIPITWNKTSKLFGVFSTTKCMLEMNCFNQEEAKNIQQKLQESELKQGEKPQTPADKLADYMGTKLDPGLQEPEKYGILAKELSQKQEIVHRLLSELDDKSESLKITSAEIVDLRRQIKLLQSENAILRKKLAADEQMEVQSIVTKEIAMMGTEELRNKILKLAQAYRDERVRNEEFDKALKNAQKEIAQARQIQHELEILQKKYAENAKKLIMVQTEIQKTTVYKETIKKQEKVIEKLEKLMESTLQDTQKARSAQLELEQLRTENYNLSSKLKMGYGGDTEVIEKQKLEIMKLEKIIADLREEIKNKRPVSQGAAQWENDRQEFEIKLEKANSRIEALQEQMIESAKNYAKEIAQLKLVIAEKQAMLDTLTLGI